MNNQATYTIRYSEWIARAGITIHDLPESLQTIIGYFLNAKEAWENADERERAHYLPVLIQTDAVIAATIYQLYKSKLESSKVDNIKLMALKAKAISLKLRNDH